MSTSKRNQIISEQDYLAGELMSEVKRELVDGDVFVMAGDSMNHERIAGNIYTRFAIHLDGSSCEPFGSDMKLRTPVGNFRYPDCMVACDSDDLNEMFVRSPVVIVEVISHSTRKTDEQIKRLEYMNIPTLKEYIMIEQDYVDVCVLKREQHWQGSHYFLGDEFVVESIDLSLSVADIYRRVVNDDMAKWIEK